MEVFMHLPSLLLDAAQCWQAELRPHNIRVCQINPSEVTTAFGNPDRIEREEVYNRLTPRNFTCYYLFN